MTQENNSPNERIVVFWNKKDNPFFKELSTAIRKPDATSQYLKNWKLIGSFKKYKQTNFSQFDKFIILAELDWNGHKLSDLYGIDILQKLRFEHSLITPCIVASFLSLEQIREIRKDRDCEVVEPLKTSFIQLPNSKLIEPQFLARKTLANDTNAANILHYFFLINDVYRENKGHYNSLLGDINALSESRYKRDYEKCTLLTKYINSRILLILRCWELIDRKSNIWQYRIQEYNKIKKIFSKILIIGEEETESSLHKNIDELSKYILK